MPRGGELGEGWSGRWVSRYTLSYREWINSKVLLYSTENYIQYPMINHMKITSKVHTHTHTHMGFPGGSDSKDLPAMQESWV